MAVSKVSYNGTTLIDISDTTAVASTVASGSGCYGADGEWVSGSLAFVTYYTGSSAPSSSLGSNGDIYLQS